MRHCQWLIDLNFLLKFVKKFYDKEKKLAAQGLKISFFRKKHCLAFASFVDTQKIYINAWNRVTRSKLAVYWRSVNSLWKINWFTHSGSLSFYGAIAIAQWKQGTVRFQDDSGGLNSLRVGKLGRFLVYFISESAKTLSAAINWYLPRFVSKEHVFQRRRISFGLIESLFFFIEFCNDSVELNLILKMWHYLLSTFATGPAACKSEVSIRSAACWIFFVSISRWSCTCAM